MDTILIILTILFIVWLFSRIGLFGNKKTKKEIALNKKETAKKLFFEIKAENHKIATAQEELKKETGQTIDDLIRQKRNKDIVQPYIKRANPRGVNDITCWKFSCISCNTELYIRCINCAHTEFKEISDSLHRESWQPSGNYLECVKCKEQVQKFPHDCLKTNKKANTYFGRNRGRFSQSNSKPWSKKYLEG